MLPRGRIVCVLALVAAASAAQGDCAKTLTGVQATPHFDIRFRRGSRAAAGVDRIAAMAERDLAAMSAELKIPVEGRYSLWLYDDEKELSAVTATSGNAGFSAGDASHVPFENDQTRFHEMVHIVAHNRLKKSGDEPRNLFFAEGLANGLLTFVHGVPVHAVAKFYRNGKKLPPIAELTGSKDFYAWQSAHPAFDAYDVGGSWFRFLLDAHGAEKVKLYYTGTPAAKAFGADERALEAAWHKALDAFVLRPEVETLLRKRHGESVDFPAWSPPKGIPAELLGAPGDWVSLMSEKPRAAPPSSWTRKGAALEGTSPGGDWSICELGLKTYKNCAVRARIRTDAPAAVQIRLGDSNQGILINGVFVYRGGAPVASSSAVMMTPERKATDFLLVRRNGSIEVWIDEAKVLSAPADESPAVPGIAVAGGTAAFEDVKVRALP